MAYERIALAIGCIVIILLTRIQRWKLPEVWSKLSLGLRPAEKSYEVAPQTPSMQSPAQICPNQACPNKGFSWTKCNCVHSSVQNKTVDHAHTEPCKRSDGWWRSWLNIASALLWLTAMSLEFFLMQHSRPGDILITEHPQTNNATNSCYKCHRLDGNKKGMPEMIKQKP